MPKTDSTAKFLYIVFALNMFLLLDILFGALSIVMWIITQNPSWGIALAAAVVVYFVTYFIVGAVGIRKFHTEFKEMKNF